MSRKKKFSVVILTVLICLISLTALVIIRDRTQETGSNILGSVAGPVSPFVFESITGKTGKTDPTPTAALTPALLPTPTPVEYTVALLNVPENMTEGGTGSFTWNVNGAPTKIHTTAVYFGTSSTPGNLTQGISPLKTGYTEVVKEFLAGEYDIPLQFVGNMPITSPGTYFARAYAYIDGQNWWSDEKSFTVKPQPVNEIKIINPPSEIAKGAAVTFTWDIIGPAATTGFTTIVIGKLSKPGVLDAAVSIPQTPYAVLVKDFISGTYNVPLRFIGNALLTEAGEYYFRALAFINGKNIWSEEYTFTVK